MAIPVIAVFNDDTFLPLEMIDYEPGEWILDKDGYPDYRAPEYTEVEGKEGQTHEEAAAAWFAYMRSDQGR